MGTNSKEYMQVWRDNNREHLQAYQLRWRIENAAQKYSTTWKSHLKKTYNLTLEQYDEMICQQGYRCAACKSEDTGRKSDHWTVDHDHVTGKVRGLLCHRCNVALGYIEDHRFENLLAYIGNKKEDH